MDSKELDKILKAHSKWLGDERGGARANLLEANLWGADLRGADLQGANLLEANLWRADLQGADLQEANLWRANLQGANLWRADLQGANLQGANLQGANLQGANLWRANLQGANLWRADLQGANLQGANLQGANLQGANLWRANLQGANLWRADLQGANLQGADLELPSIYILKDQPPSIKLVAFKFLHDDLRSPYEGFQYEIGKTYRTDDYNDDERINCDKGFNVATRQWCERYKQESDVIVRVSFKAGDIVAIPYATDGKFRVKAMKVEEIVK